MIDLIPTAHEIKQLVSMEDICRHYGVPVDARGFAQCIFHADSKPSMKIYPGNNGYHCFACGANGDIISYTMQYCSVSFCDAVKMIVHDFSLPFDVDDTDSDRQKEQQKKMEQAKRVIEAEKRAKEEAVRKYRTAMDIFALYDTWMQQYEPLWPDEEPDRRYVEACSNIDMAYENVKQAETELNRLKRK